MKNLQFHYHMEIAFSEPVHSHVYTLKCLPRTTGTQQVTECAFHIFPESKVQESEDSFGNRMLYGTEEEEHSLFQVDVTGKVITGLNNMDQQEGHADFSVYRYQTPLTRPSEQIADLRRRCREKMTESIQNSLYEKVRFYMEAVHANLQYDKGITNINTTAEETLVLGRGVCQDFSHVLLALCREDKIPARYVVGMLMGEGESHAWVEIYDGTRWQGFDPTNNVVVDDSHIKISHGRDYHDCSINRGVFTGQAKQKQSILVEVTEE